MLPDQEEARVLEQLHLIISGRPEVWDGLIHGLRPRLVHVVTCHLDRRVQHRFDAEDVVQRALQRATEDLSWYLANEPREPFFSWLRRLCLWMLQEMNRDHLGVKARAATREGSLRGFGPSGTGPGDLEHDFGFGNFVDHIADSLTSAFGQMVREERAELVRAALARLKSADRDIIFLRIFEDLTNNEAAAILGLRKDAATHRFTRALIRLEALIAAMLPGGLEAL